MTAVGWLPADATELFGPQAAADESYDVLTVDVPPESWTSALETARDRLGCTYFDWLSAVDEPGTGFRVAAHVVALGPVRRLLLRTTVPHESPVLPSAVAVYAGAAWHERETHEMFGVAFEDHPALDHLLLPEGFEGHPLRKDFVLAARVAKAWPGAKEPGESEHGGPRRRQMLPPGVPDPNEWGPLKGQLPPAPARPARGPGRATGERPPRAAADRPVRRSRTAAEGSASQGAPTPRRARSASGGSASQRTGAPEAEPTPETDTSAGTGQAASGPTARPRRARSASEGSASQRATSDARPSETDTQAPGPADDDPGTAPVPEAPAPKPPVPAAPRSADAPWHHARPAFDDAETEPDAGTERQPDRTSDEPSTAEERRNSDESRNSDQPRDSDQPRNSEESRNSEEDENADRDQIPNPKPDPNSNPNRPNPPGGPL
ncbi:NADH-quinone oxidoreductase subunit C [Streptomyces sp. NPDC058807]|uniref:NADH-quinone oxidoreductase subunit C n=1 Tax=unclassified Streptomyces TaxID=2593676 RepID=UPI0036982DEB